MSSQPPDDREISTELSGRPAKPKDGTSAAVWIARVVVVILILGFLVVLLIPSRDGTHRPRRRMEDSSRVRGIHQAMAIWAYKNRDSMPGIDAVGHVEAPSAAARYQLMLEAKLFSPEYLISPRDKQGKVWSGGPVLPENFSYALLEIATPGARREEWAGTSVSNKAAMVSSRNTGTDAGSNVRSVFTQSPGLWEGVVAYNDNHVTFESSHIIGPTQYGSATPTDADNLFLDERSGDDAYMVAD